MPKSGVRDVKGDGKDDRKHGQWEEAGAVGETKPYKADDHPEQREGVPKKEEAHKQRVRSKEVLPGGFRAEPGGDDPAAKEPQVELLMRSNQVHFSSRNSVSPNWL